MKKNYLFLTIALAILLIFPLFVRANNLGQQLAGRILLQVEENGEAWYINPKDEKRYFLGRPEDAFNLMRQLGLGVSEQDFNSFNNAVPKRLAGHILLRVEANGEAYYVDPVDLKMHFLGRPMDAFNVMRSLGLGITNQNLNKISVFGELKYIDNIDGFSFIYPAEAVVEKNVHTHSIRIANSKNSAEYYYIVIYYNPSRLDLADWFYSYFNNHYNQGCHVMSSNLIVGQYNSLLFSSQTMDNHCQNGGYYTINPDKSLVIKWDIGHEAPFLETITQTFQFN